MATSTKPRSPSRINRAFTAVDRELVDTLNRIARQGTVMNGGFAITQRQVHDTLLRHTIRELGESGAAHLTREAMRQQQRSGAD
jgi:hypothetical protein